MKPSSFGQYVLLHRLATGGMGEVYLAIRRITTGFKQVCALKKTRAALGQVGDFEARLGDEARLLATMSHPNVVSVLDLGHVGQERFIAMELVHGRDVGRLLSHCYRARRHIPLGVALHIVGELLKALDYCHRHTDALRGGLEVVHRDISPGNLLLSFDGAVKLADFGLAASELKSVRTAPDVVMGQPGYIAPEVLAGQSADHRSDLFCAAIVLYELVTCQPYTRSREAGALLAELRGAAGRRMSEMRGGIPPALDEVLGIALDLDPQRRFGSARQLYRALETVRHGLAEPCGAFELGDLLDELFDAEQERQRLQDLLQRWMGRPSPRRQAPRWRRFGPEESALTLITPDVGRRAAGGDEQEGVGSGPARHQKLH